MYVWPMNWSDKLHESQEKKCGLCEVHLHELRFVNHEPGPVMNSRFVI